MFIISNHYNMCIQHMLLCFFRRTYSAHSTRTGAGFTDADGPTLTFVFCTHLHGEMKERQGERESDGSKWKKERESLMTN